MEVTRHIKTLYVRAHLNGRLVSKVLINNGSTVNVMPLRMLRALGMIISDLIETEVVVSAFIGEVSKTLGILPIDTTIGSRTSLSAFFVINSTTNYNILLRRDRIHATLQQIIKLATKFLGTKMISSTNIHNCGRNLKFVCKNEAPYFFASRLEF